RAVEGEEGAIAVACWELLSVVERQVVGCPVSREGGGRSELVRAQSDLLAVAAVFGREQELPLHFVVVAVGPAVVAAVHDVHELLGWQIGALRRGVQLRPVLAELVPAVLRRVELMVRGIEREPFSIAYAGGISGRRRELLLQLLGAVAPDAGARRQLGAG